MRAVRLHPTHEIFIEAKYPTVVFQPPEARDVLGWLPTPA